MYSVPLRYSCSSTAASWAPHFRCEVISSSKWPRTSSTVWQSFTPSDPADSTGLTMMGRDSVFVKASTSPHALPQTERTDLRPAALTASCCTCLSRRFAMPLPVGLPRRPMYSASASATFTPVSPPHITAASSATPAALRRAWAVSAIEARSSSSTRNFSGKPFAASGRWPRFSPTSSVQSAMTEKPRRSRSGASIAPVE
mmetsp:Transcript_49223/g.145317  ORF Transcript_49223/g.145317 Transcript_49223/m.145317 type:complete len:200 (-) Transcript_49223:160-759(-)